MNACEDLMDTECMMAPLSAREKLVGSSDEDESAERCVSSSMSSKNIEKKSKDEVKKNTTKRMTELISLQKSNGEFKISDEDWTGSVLEEYLGSYSDVKSNCPSGIEMNLWITALSMKLLETKMEDKKDLWDLVMRKSHKFLIKELNGSIESLLDLAAKYVTTWCHHQSWHQPLHAGSSSVQSKQCITRILLLLNKRPKSHPFRDDTIDCFLLHMYLLMWSPKHNIS